MVIFPWTNGDFLWFSMVFCMSTRGSKTAKAPGPGSPVHGCRGAHQRLPRDLGLAAGRPVARDVPRGQRDAGRTRLRSLRALEELECWGTCHHMSPYWSNHMNHIWYIGVSPKELEKCNVAVVDSFFVSLCICVCMWVWCVCPPVFLDCLFSATGGWIEPTIRKWSFNTWAKQRQ